MKNTILYSFIFAFAFIGTTYVLYDLNNKFENIFQFDFRLSEELALADSLASEGLETDLVSDSTNVQDETEKISEQLEKDFNETKNKLAKTTQELSRREKELVELKKKISTEAETNHTEWLKSTVKLYEEMESVKASELLRSLPSDEARELLYSMKKKKAADILSNLDTETVKRLTRAKK